MLKDRNRARCQEENIARQARVSCLEHVQADEFGDRYLWRQGLTPLPSWKSKVARHAAKRKAAKLHQNPSKPKKLKIDDPLKAKPASDLRTVRLVDYSDDEEPTRRVVFHSEDETSKISAEGSGPSPATLELDSTMGVGSRIDLPREGSVETAYRRLKEVIDEPSSPVNKKGSFTPDFKAVSCGMRSGSKKIARTQIRDTRVYSYVELIEYRPMLEDSDDDSFWFSIDDTKKEF